MSDVMNGSVVEEVNVGFKVDSDATKAEVLTTSVMVEDEVRTVLDSTIGKLDGVVASE